MITETVVEHMPNDQLAILIIDDDRASRRLLAAMLGSRGYDVLEATTGQSGIAVARAMRPGLIILDLELPDMSGVRAALALKADARTRNIPIVATTVAPYSVRAVAEARHCGNDTANAIDYSDLLRAVETLFSRLVSTEPGRHPE